MDVDLSALATTVVLVGGGRMGLALASGWLEAGLQPGLLRVVDPRPSGELGALSAKYGFRAETAYVPGPADVLVLATKPQIIDQVAGGLSVHVDGKCLILSIMAGVRTARLRQLFPAAAGVVRAMPNLPASVRCGATALFSDISGSGRDLVGQLMATVGHVEWLDNESLIDAATAVSGSGPGYMFYLVECLARAGEEAGLDRGASERLARATLVGAGALLARSSLSAAELRAAVTSPGGTTEAGLRVLADRNRLGAILTDAVLAARDRSRELAT